MEGNDASRRTRAALDRSRDQGVFRVMLQTLAEGVTEAAGFGVAVISVLRRTEEFEVVAVAGDESAREALLGRFTAYSVIAAELAVAEEWGTLRYVAHDVSTQADNPGWIPDYEPDDDPDSWHPLDLLMAPLRDGDGELIGLLSVDLPEGGRRPGPEQIARLEAYAAQAGRTMAHALRDTDLAEEVRLAAAAREIVRQASARLTIEEIIDECGDGLLEAFGANGVWLQTVDGDVSAQAIIRLVDLPGYELPGQVVALATAAAKTAWAEQRAAILSHRRVPFGVINAEERKVTLAYLETIGVASLLFVPLGAGTTVLGCLALTRPASAPEWSDNEMLIAQDIGQDLGRALRNAQLFERERQVSEELGALAAYRTQLVNTLAHELRTPLTSIKGHAEVVEDLAPEGFAAIGSVRAVQRSVERLEGIITELLALAHASDPGVARDDDPVDVIAVLENTCELLRIQASERSVHLRCETPSSEVILRGKQSDFERIATNLMGNAIKYSPPHTTVTVRLAMEGDDVVLVVADEGYGIPEDDQASLFTEFVRSSDPRSKAQPGTGLGLAIVQRTVERYGGTISLESKTDVGSTFTVRIPKD